MLLLVGLVTACTPPPVCEQANDLLLPCLYGTKSTSTTEPYTIYDSGYGYFPTCEEGSVRACQAGCVVTAIEAKGCEGVTDQFQNSDYLKCYVDCADAGSK